MQKPTFLLINLLVVSLLSFSQRNTFTFSAVNNTSYVQLDSIMIKNLETGSINMYYFPDTSISYNPTYTELLFVGYATISTVGIQNSIDDAKGFTMFPNYPNPVTDNTTIPLYIPEKGELTLQVFDLIGRLEYQANHHLNKGYHSLNFIPGTSSTYIVSAVWRGKTQSIKIISQNPSNPVCWLEYSGSHVSLPLNSNNLTPKSGEMRESGIIDTPGSNNKDYVFQFAYDIPCPGIPTVTYEGQVYNTVQVLSQCWLQENLNVGIMISNSGYQEDNEIIEKYCPENSEDSCTKYGGFYQWGEAMKYIVQEGSQGLCPPGWHIPTDEEIKVLEGISDSQYLIGDDIWNITGAYRGSDCGFNLKSENYWNEGMNGTNLYGMTLLPSGLADPGIHYASPGENAGFWSSSSLDYSTPFYRNIWYPETSIKRSTANLRVAFAIRCLKD